MGNPDAASEPNGTCAGQRGRIDAGTRIGDLLGDDPGVLGRLAVVEPALRDLALGSAEAAAVTQMTIGEIAERAGLPVAAVLAVITGVAPHACLTGGDVRHDEAKPDWMAGFDHQRAARLDVRPLLSAGSDPFTTVMAKAATVPPGGGLVIDAPFDPVPLRRVLGKRGFQTFAEWLGERHWSLYCLRDASPAQDRRSALPSATVWREGDGVHIDVRGLTAPSPMIAILALIDGGGHQVTIVVHHEREPAYLFPELADRGWDWEHLAGEPGEVRLRLTRGA